MNRVHKERLVAAAFVVLTTVSLLFVLASGAEKSSAAQKQRAARARAQNKVVDAKKPHVDYAKFSHQTHVVAQKLECNSCHKVPAKNWRQVRTGDAAFPDVSDFPEHASCLDCHRQQFFADRKSVV